MKMNRIIMWARDRQVAISMIVALFGFALAAALFPNQANAQTIPETMHLQQQMFRLVCGTPEDIRDVLLTDHNEIAVVAGLLDSGHQYLLYVNEDKTTFSFVIHKSKTDACIVWSGASAKGQVFMMNPNLSWPVPKTTIGETYE
jgi:hypothetical protein